MDENSIERFLDFHNIPYITSGRNCKKGNYNVHCPWCSHDDGYHMGIDPRTGYYGCWRDSRHRGRDTAKLIKELINCSWEEANRIAGKEASFEDGDDLMAMANALFDEDKQEEEKILGGATYLPFPRSWNMIMSSGSTGRFWKYLEGRGFTNISRLVSKYEIYCCLTGEDKMRLIFPIYYQDKLVSWVGRSIYNGALLPYKDLSVEESVIHPKFTFYNYDIINQKGKVLMISEGLFDMLKLDYYSPKGFRATCLLTKSITDEQKYLLIELAKLYEEVWLVLDDDAYGQMLDMASELFMIRNLKTPSLPDGVGDPGDMNEKEVQLFIANNYNGGIK